MYKQVKQDEFIVQVNLESKGGREVFTSLVDGENRFTKHGRVFAYTKDKKYYLEVKDDSTNR